MYTWSPGGPKLERTHTYIPRVLYRVAAPMHIILTYSPFVVFFKLHFLVLIVSEHSTN